MKAQKIQDFHHILATLLLFSFSVVADVTTSKLQVHIPQSLSQTGGYDHRDALFGIPPYGGAIQEKVYYAADTLCNPLTDKKIGFPVEKDKNGDRIAWQPPFILMIDRGDCTFVQKVRNAQHAGAAAVLIADNVCQCGAEDCEMPPHQVLCEAQEPIMADDGSGDDITVPSFLLFKQDSDKIKKVITQNQPVRIEMSFSVPAPDTRVEYDLWMTPADPVSKPFLKSFEKAAVELQEHAFFTPHMFIYDGSVAGCHEKGINENYCGDLCTNAGRYCTTDPDGDMASGISGADVVTESLRRICIWNEYGESDGIGKQWWLYVRAFMEDCDDGDNPDSFTDDACIKASMKKAGVDETKVNKCMLDSGGLDGDVENTLFAAEIAKKEEIGALLLPSMFVNKAPVRGELVFNTIFKAVCSGYATGSEPDICKSCAFCHNVEACVEKGHCDSGYDGIQVASGGVSGSTFITTMLIVIVGFSVSGYIIYRRQQRHMRDQIRGIMAEYMPVDPNKTPTDTAVSDEVEFSFS